MNFAELGILMVVLTVLAYAALYYTELYLQNKEQQEKAKKHNKQVRRNRKERAAKDLSELVLVYEKIEPTEKGE